MSYPKISVITPSFNQGAYLEDTIRSVLGQEYPNLEYIIIDGGSTDNSADIIRKYEKHLSYWISEKDKGMYHAIQKGFDRSSGEILAYLNSDDMFHTKSLFTVAEIFSSFKNVEWIQGMPSEFDEKGRISSVGAFRHWSKYNFFLGEYEWIRQESCFWRRSLWERAGGKLDISLRYAGDFELWQRFFDYAELYGVRTILGGFRARNKDQFSVEKMKEYKAEVKAVHEKRMENLTSEEKRQMDKLMMYRNVYKKIPGLKTRMYKWYIRNFKYPPHILFDRPSQSFMMK